MLHRKIAGAIGLALGLTTLIATHPAQAATLDTGNTAWMLTATGLVLFMTLPGLALFYGGLVRSKNVLSIMAQCMGIAGLVTLLWWAFGYSMTFAPGGPLAPDDSYHQFL